MTASLPSGLRSSWLFFDDSLNFRVAVPEGVDQVRVAGGLEWERSEQWITNGVPFHRDQISTLAEVCTANRCDLPDGWPAA